MIRFRLKRTENGFEYLEYFRMREALSLCTSFSFVFNFMRVENPQRAECRSFCKKCGACEMPANIVIPNEFKSEGVRRMRLDVALTLRLDICRKLIFFSRSPVNARMPVPRMSIRHRLIPCERVFRLKTAQMTGNGLDNWYPDRRRRPERLLPGICRRRISHALYQ